MTKERDSLLPSWVVARLRDERGMALVEFALVLPMLALLLVGIAQFSLAFFVRSEMLNVAREASRQLATGHLTTGETRGWVAAQLPEHDASLTVAVTPPGGGSNLYTVTLSMPLADAVPIDPFGLLSRGTLSATVSMRDEVGA